MSIDIGDRELPPSDRAETPELSAAPKLEPVKIDHALLERLKQRMAGKISWSDIARDIGVGASAVSKWQNEKYEGDVENLEALLRKWEKDFDLRVDLRRDNVPTAMTARIIRDINRVVRTKQLSVATGRAGIEKTAAVELFCADDASAVLVRAAPGHGDARAMIADVWEQTGTRRRKDEQGLSATDILFKRLAGTARVLIVDDFHDCTVGGLRWLIGLHKMTRMPVMLVGNPAGLDKIKRMTDEDQYTSRVGFCPRWALTEEDSKELTAVLLAQYAPALREDLFAAALQVACKRGFGRKLKHQLCLTLDILDGGLNERSKAVKEMKAGGMTDAQIAFRLADAQLLKVEEGGAA